MDQNTMRDGTVYAARLRRDTKAAIDGQAAKQGMTTRGAILRGLCHVLPGAKEAIDRELRR